MNIKPPEIDKDMLITIIFIIFAVVGGFFVGMYYMSGPDTIYVTQSDYAVNELMEEEIESQYVSVPIAEEDYINDSVYRFVEFPQDRINGENFYMDGDEIVIRNIAYLVDDLYFTSRGTGSMYPLLDEGAETIIARPPENEIYEGDIITFRTDDGLTVHRVVERGYDEKGLYFITKGDNNGITDDYKIRYENIEGVIIAVFY